jgi:hypothetical protein
MTRFRGMYEVRWRPGTGHGGCYLAGNMPGFSDATYDDAPAASEYHLDSFEELRVHAIHQGADRIRLNGQYSARELEHRSLRT